MRIEKDKVVTLDYQLQNADGESLEEDGAQVAYLHGGYDGIFPKVEEALDGKEVGHEVNVTLEPEDAFGERDEELHRQAVLVAKRLVRQHIVARNAEDHSIEPVEFGLAVAEADRLDGAPGRAVLRVEIKDDVSLSPVAGEIHHLHAGVGELE